MGLSSISRDLREPAGCFLIVFYLKENSRLIKLWWDRAASKRQSRSPDMEGPVSPEHSAPTTPDDKEKAPLAPSPDLPKKYKPFERNKMTGTFFRKKTKNKAPLPPTPTE